MQCVQAMPAGVGQWVWVSDFKGFGMSDCDPRLAKVFLDLSAAHYPERLGLFLIIDAPWSAPFFYPWFLLCGVAYMKIYTCIYWAGVKQLHLLSRQLWLVVRPSSSVCLKPALTVCICRLFRTPWSVHLTDLDHAKITCTQKERLAAAGPAYLTQCCVNLSKTCD